MTPMMRRQLDSQMMKDEVLIVEPHLAEQAAYLRQNGFAPRSRPQFSDVTKQKFQWWDRVAEVVGWSSRRDGLFPILKPYKKRSKQ